MQAAKKAQEEAARAVKQKQHEMELEAQQQQAQWNRRGSALPESAMAHDRPEPGRITSTQRQQFHPQVLSAPEAEDKPAKPKIPKAGRSQLPGSYAQELDPNGSKSDRAFTRKKTPFFWPRPRNW